MTTRDRYLGGDNKPQHRRKNPSFSSSLLDAICHSIDESREGKPKQDFTKRGKPFEVEEDTTSLKKAMMVEKWMENHTKYSKSSRHFTSDSSSSTDSSIFSSSEPESSSLNTPKSSSFAIHTPQTPQTPQPYHFNKPQKTQSCSTTPKNEGRFNRTKTKALKIYTDLKKGNQPISPGRKFTNFLNSLFSSRNMKKHQQTMEDHWSSSVMNTRSRSVKDSTTMCGLSSRSCLNKPPSPTNKSKRCVRFDPVNVIVGDQGYSNHISFNRPNKREDNQPPSYPKNIYDIDPIFKPVKSNKYDFKDLLNQESYYDNGDDDDDRSCTSSDLFELENIGTHAEELPVYGTTNLKINQAIAKGLFM